MKLVEDVLRRLDEIGIDEQSEVAVFVVDADDDYVAYSVSQDPDDADVTINYGQGTDEFDTQMDGGKLYSALKTLRGSRPVVLWGPDGEGYRDPIHAISKGQAALYLFLH